MRQENNVTITRGDLALVASIVAASGLVVAGLAALQQSGMSIVSWIALVIAGLGVAVWAFLTPKEFVATITGRQMRRGVTSVIATGLLVGIVVTTYIILEREVLTVDMTDSQEFTLSPATLEILTNVARPMRITGFYDASDVQSRQINDQFFRLYEVATDGTISRNYIDPVEQPTLAQAFNARSGDVFISFVEDDGTVDPEQAQYVPLAGAQERDMTQAILRLLSTGDFVVYFSLGNGELSPADVEDTGIGLATELLVQNGVSVDAIVFSQLIEAGADVPLDASAIIIPRPLRQFTTEEINLLDRYLERGGALFIMADYTLDENGFLREGDPFNDYLWENWGLRVLDAVVVDRVASGATPTDLKAYAVFDNEIGRNIDPADEQFQTMFRVARAVEVDTEPPVSNGNVIQSSPESFGETNLEALASSGTFQWDAEEDIQGPLTTVGWARDNDTGGEIILVGDSDFLTGGYIGSPLGNASLFTDGIGWMTGFDDQVRIEPQAVAGSSPLIFVSPSTLDVIAFITLMLLPGTALVLGIGVWLYRSRR